MDDLRFKLAIVTERFPEEAVLIRRLCLADQAFRALCEDYALARQCLLRFEAAGEPAHAAEIEDYRSVIASLEAEIGGCLAGVAHTRR